MYQAIGTGIPFFTTPEEIRAHAEYTFGIDWFMARDYLLHGYAMPMAASNFLWGFIASVPRSGTKRTFQAHIYDCRSGEIDYGNDDWSENFVTFEAAEKFLVGLIGGYYGFTTTTLWDMLGADYFATDEPFTYVFIAKSSSTDRYQVCVVDKLACQITSHAGGMSDHQEAYKVMLELGGKDNYPLDYTLKAKDKYTAPIKPVKPKRVIVPAWRPF